MGFSDGIMSIVSENPSRQTYTHTRETIQSTELIHGGFILGKCPHPLLVTIRRHGNLAKRIGGCGLLNPLTGVFTRPILKTGGTGAIGIFKVPGVRMKGIGQKTRESRGQNRN